MADTFLPVGPHGLLLKMVDQGDGTYAIATVAGASATTINTATAGSTLLTYKATAAGAGYAIADILTMTRHWDTTPAVPTVKSTVWRNETANTVIAAPLAADIELAGGATGSGEDLEFVTAEFAATAAGTGYSIGDKLVAVHAFNILATPPTLQSTQWVNATTSALLAAAPGAGTFGQPTVQSSVSFATARNLSLNNAAWVVKATPGKVHGWTFISENTVPVYVNFYDSAAPTGASTPIRKIVIGALHALADLPSVQHLVDCPATAISIRCVTGRADADNTAPTLPVYAEVNYV